MRSQKLMVLIIVALSLTVVMGTFIAAFSVSQMNKKGVYDDYSQTLYSSFPKTSKPESAVIGSEESSSAESEIDSENQVSSEESSDMSVSIEAGIYVNGNNSIMINSSDNGFIEAKAICGEITMEFSGQAVNSVLVATGTDSLNNTVEVTLTFSENYITAQSKPLIMYEDMVECIEISGRFTK